MEASASVCEWGNADLCFEESQNNGKGLYKCSPNAGPDWATHCTPSDIYISSSAGLARERYFLGGQLQEWEEFGYAVRF